MLEIAVLAIYVFILSIILVYCCFEMKLAINYLRSKKKKSEQLFLSENTPIQDHPFVTIQLPVFNELYVVERLIDQVAKFNYPKERFEIQVLDDSTDETVEISRNKVEELKAKGFNIELIHRVDRTGYKAGALQNGMQVCKGEFIAIFDADFLPDPNFLRSTMPYFNADDIGVVQTRWSHINEKYSLLTKIQAFFLDAHFTVEQKGRNSQGFFINFNGTAGVWRKATIEDAGGWQADTITEDLDLSYRSQMKGWRFVYLEDVLSPAELPVDIKSFKSQQFRWIKGGAETARKILPQINKKELPLSIKINAYTHLLSSSIYLLIFVLVFLSVPMLILRNTYIETDYIRFAFPYLFTNVAIIFFFFSSNTKRYKKLSGIFEFIFMLPAFLSITLGLSFHNAMAAARGLAREETPFIRTPKFNLMTTSDKWKGKKYLTKNIGGTTLIEGVLALYFLFGIFYAFYNYKFDLLPLHIMAFCGFTYVFTKTLRHSWR